VAGKEVELRLVKQLQHKELEKHVLEVAVAVEAVVVVAVQ
jgi:hypothetical protein